MPHKFFAHLTEPLNKTTISRQPFSTPVTLLILFLSILTILWSLVSLFDIDFEVVLFLRSIPIQTIDEIGRIGNRLGHGTTLVLISVGLGIVGYAWNRDRFKRAGWQSLFAHGIAGLIIQTIKHLLGRPRPRFMHQDHWLMGPSFQGGLDTFPSGHSAASFAVAAVLTRNFPKGAWVWYGAAGFVAISRIMKGSHFPSDALAGSLIGFLVGYILARPIKYWHISLLEAFVQGLPYWVGGFSLIWIVFHYPEPGLLQMVMFWVGLIMIMLGFGVRMLLNLNSNKTILRYHIRLPTASLTMGIGMALYTESLLVALLAVSTAIAWWLGNSSHAERRNLNHEREPVIPKRVAQEALMAIAIIAFLLGLQQVKGLIPLQ